MVVGSDLGFVLITIQIWFGFYLGPDSDPVWVLVVYDLALSLSLSRQILVMDWLRFVFVDLVWVDPNLCFWFFILMNLCLWSSFFLWDGRQCVGFDYESHAWKLVAMQRCVWPKTMEEFGERKWLVVGLKEGHLSLWTMFHLSTNGMQLMWLSFPSNITKNLT